MKADFRLEETKISTFHSISHIFNFLNAILLLECRLSSRILSSPIFRQLLSISVSSIILNNNQCFFLINGVNFRDTVKSVCWCQFIKIATGAKSFTPFLISEQRYRFLVNHAGGEDHLYWCSSAESDRSDIGVLSDNDRMF